MKFDSIESLPRRVLVQEIVKSRYARDSRPASWDERVAGTDVVRTSEGLVLQLTSDGQQSPPQPGWEILLRDGDAEGYSWTLYGMPRISH